MDLNLKSNNIWKKKVKKLPFQACFISAFGHLGAKIHSSDFEKNNIFFTKQQF
jgi:hypothetical protein